MEFRRAYSFKHTTRNLDYSLKLVESLTLMTIVKASHSCASHGQVLLATSSTRFSDFREYTSIRPTPSLRCFSYSSLTCVLRRPIQRTLESLRSGDVELLAKTQGGRYIGGMFL